MVYLAEHEPLALLATLNDPTQRSRHQAALVLLRRWWNEASAGMLKVSSEQRRVIEAALLVGQYTSGGRY